MMNLTPFARPLLKPRLEAVRRWTVDPEGVQRRELMRMLQMARTTEWGRQHGYAAMRSYEDYRRGVEKPTQYEEIRPLVMRMVSGERDVLWPGRTRCFAQSSGTQDGRSKYIPIPEESFRRSHFRGAKHPVAHYLDCVPGSRLFGGCAFILGGSFANSLTLPRGVHVGDLSANLIAEMPRVADAFRVPKLRTALMEDWTQKLPRLAREAARVRSITNLSGVPSWFLTVLRQVLAITGADSIRQVWPNLEVFFHGGISFEPYRDQYRQIIPAEGMHYLENYNASEGFFACQNDLADPAMLLLLDCGTFYEFIPIEDVERDNPRILPLWEVERGGVYALVISSVNGLWRYMIGDTVRIESTEPVKITIAGRTRHYINAFGEEVMVHNADAAIANAQRRMPECRVANYTVAPVYAAGGRRGRHQWLIEFSDDLPRADVEQFAAVLDDALRTVNSDYDAKRTGSLFLDPLEVVVAPEGLFDRYLAMTGKLGGQRKVPRLQNNRALMDKLLNLRNQPREA